MALVRFVSSRQAQEEPDGPAALSPWPMEATAKAAAIVRLRTAVAGRTLNDDGAADALGATASALVQRYAPGAPQACRDEAVIRAAGYLAGSDFGAFLQEPTSVGGKDGGRYVTNHASLFRNSGAAALLAPWRVRRAGAIG